MKTYQITKLVWLGREQQAAADFVSHCSSDEIGRGLALANCRHVFGADNVSYDPKNESITVRGVFSAHPQQSKSPFSTVATRNPFA